MKLVRSVDKNLPLYYLALFSRNEMAVISGTSMLESAATEQGNFLWTKLMSLFFKDRGPTRRGILSAGAPKSAQAARTAMQSVCGALGVGASVRARLRRPARSALVGRTRRLAPRMIFVNSMSDLFHEEVPD